jgi:hypothetical protein
MMMLLAALHACSSPLALADLGLVVAAEVGEDGTHTFRIALGHVPQNERDCAAYRITYGLDDLRYGDGLSWGGGYAAFDPQVGGFAAEFDSCTSDFSFTVDRLVALPSPAVLWVAMGQERAEAAFQDLDATRTLARSDGFTVHGYEPIPLRYDGPAEDVLTHGYGELEILEPRGYDLADGINVMELVVDVSGSDVLAAVSPDETWHTCESRCGRDVALSVVVWADAAVGRCDGFSACAAYVATTLTADAEWSLRE